MAKKARQSKTMWFNSFGIILELLLFSVTKDVIPIPPQYQALIILALDKIINLILRVGTKEGIEFYYKKEK